MRKKKYIIIVRTNDSMDHLVYFYPSDTIKDCITTAMKNISEKYFQGEEFDIFYDFQENSFGAIGFEGEGNDLLDWNHCSSSEIYKIVRPFFSKTKRCFFSSYKFQFELKSLCNIKKSSGRAMKSVASI